MGNKFTGMSIEEMKALGIEIEETSEEKEELYEDEFGNLVDEHGNIIVEYADREDVTPEEDYCGEDAELLDGEDTDSEIESLYDEEKSVEEDSIDTSPEDIKKEMLNVGSEDDERGEETLFDNDGNPIELQKDGTLSIEILKLADIFIPPRTRKNDSASLVELEKSILKWGLIEPLHVVPFKDKYILVSGVRRYIAMKNLRMEEAACIIDTTRRKDIIRYLEVISNNTKHYSFIEQMEFGAYIEKKQPVLKSEVIENILGMETGDYLRAKYIQAMDEFGILSDIILGKKTIKEGFKRLEKELNKVEKEKMEELEVKLNDDGTIDYNSLQLDDPNQQTTKDRKPLERHIVDRIRARDGHTCQSCGLGYYQEELGPVFETHHIIPVHNHGNDDDSNLVTLCSNCHKVVHAYADGKFRCPPDRLRSYGNMIVLGNIIKNGVPEGRKPHEFFMETAEQPWIE